jgi:hypothetical protein
MAYFGEVLKMCANVAYLMMTLNRYLLVGKDHAAWLVSIAKLEFKWVIRGSFLFSVLINIGHGWQYQAVEYKTIRSQTFYLYTNTYVNTPFLYNQINGFSYSDYPEATQTEGYFIYSIVYCVINFGVFFILNTGIEVKIVRRMHKELKEKRERLAKMDAAKPFSSAAVETAPVVGLESKPQTNEDKKREEEDSIKERRVIKMVVFNSVFNFVLRASDLLFWIEYHGSWFGFFSCILNIINDNIPGFLGLLVDMGYFFYILTFIINFVIFYKFNKNFNEAVVFFWTKAKPKT